MARPSLIRPQSGGEIILKNIDPELTKAIKALVESIEAKPQLPSPASVHEIGTIEPVAQPIVTGEHPMTKTAIGTYKDINEVWKLAYIKYNPVSLQARVDKTINVGFDRAEVSEKFKIEAVKTGQVE